MKNFQKQKEILFIIPARSGSKGVKNKNLKLCAGESLLRRAVKIAINMDFDSRVIVSTDSEKYLNHVEDLKCSKNFLRPSYLSEILLGILKFLLNLCILLIEFNENYKCVAMLQPTSPLRQNKHFADSINAVINDSWDASFTANKVDLKYHPLKSLTISKNGSSNYYLDEGSNIIGRQMLSQTYIRNGACYSITPECLTIVRSFIGLHSKIIKLNQW